MEIPNKSWHTIPAAAPPPSYALGVSSNKMDYFTSTNTGNAPKNLFRQTRSVTDKDKVDIWFCEPLEKMKGDEAFACMMICFPLLELMIRKELSIPDDQDVPFSDGSNALKWFSKFLTIPEDKARLVWDAFRNGLAHRGMIKESIDYRLTGAASTRPARFENGILEVYVWTLRDAVVRHLRKEHRNLWKGSSSPLPGIYINS